MGTHLTYHAAAVHLFHHAYPPARQSFDGKPCGIRYGYRIAFLRPQHTETSVGFGLRTFRCNQFAIVCGAVERSCLVEQQAHRVYVAVEARIGDAALYRLAFRVLFRLPFFHHNGVEQVEVQVTLRHRGGQYLAIARIDDAPPCRVCAQAGLSFQSACTPVVSVDPLYLYHTHNDGNATHQCEQQIEGGHPLRHPCVLFIFFLFQNLVFYLFFSILNFQFHTAARS